jgi:outer membrane murein-binding lipoprotein Lpp
MQKMVRVLGMAAVLLSLGSCVFGGKRNPQEKKQLEQSVAAISAEVETLQAQVGALRAQTDGLVGRYASDATSAGVPGGDAATLNVQWSSVHAGSRLTGRLLPQGRGERLAAGVEVLRGAP